MIGYLLTLLLQIYCRVWWCKNFENRLAFRRVTSKNKVAPFFPDTVYICLYLANKQQQQQQQLLLLLLLLQLLQLLLLVYYYYYYTINFRSWQLAHPDSLPRTDSTEVSYDLRWPCRQSRRSLQTDMSCRQLPATFQVAVDIAESTSSLWCGRLAAAY